MSNDKISAIVRALKTFLFRVLKLVSSQQVEEAQVIEKVQTILSERTALKEKMIGAVTKALQSEL